MTEALVFDTFGLEASIAGALTPHHPCHCMKTLPVAIASCLLVSFIAGQAWANPATSALALLAQSTPLRAINLRETGQVGRGQTASHTFRAEAGQNVTIWAESSEFDTFIRLYDGNNRILAENDDAGGGTNSNVTVTLPQSGTYRLDLRGLNSFDAGRYSISVTSQGANHPPAASRTLRLNQIEQGDLRQGDRVAYSFQGNAGQDVVITLDSSQFDTYLYLYDSNGRLVAENDDADGTNSRLSLRLPTSGTYQVQVRGFSEAAAGHYALLVRENGRGPGSPNPPNRPELPRLVPSDRFYQRELGYLRQGDRRTHSFQGQPGRVTLSLQSQQFDTYLRLFDGDGRLLAENDDADGSTNSQISLNLPRAGRYRVEVSGFSSAAQGEYSLEVRY